MKRLIIAFALFLLVAPTISAQFTPERKLQLAHRIIEGYYVDEVDSAKVVQEAIVGMLKTLDPHSTYSTPEETKELTEPLNGNFSGIGIRFQMVNDTLYIIESIADGPSERLGIQAGDRIISCNDTIISGVGMENNDIMKILRGPKGTIANLKVKRNNVPELLTFRVVRDDIPIYSVDGSFMANDSVGYISITRFAESTTDEVNEAMKNLRKQGMKHLIINLTDNGGGYLKQAIEVANLFLRKGDTIVYTDSPKNGKSVYEANENGSFKGRVVVMVNQFSASASEILSGALQDHDRGVIVGRRTFGKGLVQRPFPFPDGSMIRLTVSRYHTPSGRCIQKPYADGEDENYDREIINRYKSGEFSSADSIHFVDSLLYHTLRLGRPVYGGGGIMPDRFVAIDTTYYSPYYRDLVARGAVNNYSVNYVDKNRKELMESYPYSDDFISNFIVTPAIMQGLIDEGEKEGVKYNEEEFIRSKSYLEAILKGLIGRDLYEQSVYYRVVNSLDPIYITALEIITSPQEYNTILSSQM
ncbi:MAG: S41 family peptidase [Duncaniella sp.]|nr:S41 family peptidase [Muribaculum sp.]MCM1255927.1 S41 family peptidase [Duncaniella sp.]